MSRLVLRRPVVRQLAHDRPAHEVDEVELQDVLLRHRHATSPTRAPAAHERHPLAADRREERQAGHPADRCCRPAAASRRRCGRCRGWTCVLISGPRSPGPRPAGRAWPGVAEALVVLDLQVRELHPDARQVEGVGVRGEAAVGLDEVAADLLRVLDRLGRVGLGVAQVALGARRGPCRPARTPPGRRRRRPAPNFSSRPGRRRRPCR